jgi:outer membrane protein assembly factor BamB
LLDAQSGGRVADVEVPSFGYAEPAVGDLDGDGCPDLVALGWYEGAAYAAISGRTRTLLWQGRGEVPAWSGAVIGDGDNDGRPEVFFITRVGSVFALRGSTGTLLWRRELDDRTVGTMAGLGLARFDPAETATVVASCGDRRLVLLDAATGQSRQTIDQAGGTPSRPTFADADGDGIPEILVGGPDGLLCVNRNGGRLWQCRTGAVAGDPVVVDLESDGRSEVLFGDAGGLVVCLELASGRARWAWSAALDDESGEPAAQGRDLIEATVSVADVDGDGIRDVIVSSHNGTITCVSGRGRL